MKLNNIDANQDRTLTDCISFGGKAAAAAKIAEELDNKLTEALTKIEELEQTACEYRRDDHWQQ